MYSNDDKAEMKTKNFVGQNFFFFLIKPGEFSESHYPNSSIGTEGDNSAFCKNAFLMYTYSQLKSGFVICNFQYNLQNSAWISAEAHKVWKMVNK